MLIPLFWTPSFQNYCEKINFRCFRPPTLQYFVTTAAGTVTTAAGFLLSLANGEHQKMRGDNEASKAGAFVLALLSFSVPSACNPSRFLKPLSLLASSGPGVQRGLFAAVRLRHMHHLLHVI